MNITRTILAIACCLNMAASAIPAGAKKLSAQPVNRQYAMFIIPVNDGAHTNEYLDIELKASTNNFSETPKLVYYCHSAMNGMGQDGYDDCMMFVENQTADGSDDRTYKKISNTIALEDDKINRIVVLVRTNDLRRVPDGKWLSENNTELIWTYARSRESIREDGDAWVWRPIAPVRWFSALPEWASSQE